MLPSSLVRRMRLAFFVAVSAVIGACSLAYPTQEREEDAGRADTGPRCVVGGEYCGNDKVIGDPSTLYVCLADGGGRVLKRCDAGCEVAPPGTDDYCR